MKVSLMKKAVLCAALALLVLAFAGCKGQSSRGSSEATVPVGSEEGSAAENTVSTESTGSAGVAGGSSQKNGSAGQTGGDVIIDVGELDVPGASKPKTGSTTSSAVKPGSSSATPGINSSKANDGWTGDYIINKK